MADRCDRCEMYSHDLSPESDNSVCCYCQDRPLDFFG